MLDCLLGDDASKLGLEQKKQPTVVHIERIQWRGSHVEVWSSDSQMKRRDSIRLCILHLPSFD